MTELEAKAVWVTRFLAHKSDRFTADAELVEIADSTVGGQVGGMLLLCESYMAWSLGRPRDAEDFARRARRLFRASGNPPGHVMARVMELAGSGAWDELRALQDTVADSIGSGVTGCGLALATGAGTGWGGGGGGLSQAHSANARVTAAARIINHDDTSS